MDPSLPASNAKKRKPNWTPDQCLFLTRLVDESKGLLLDKLSSGVTAAKKKEKWAEIAGSINAAFPWSFRTPDEVEKKWYNTQSKSRLEISQYKRATCSTGNGKNLLPPLSATSNVVWDNLGKDNVSISGIPTSTDSTMLQVLDMTETETSEMRPFRHWEVLSPSPYFLRKLPEWSPPHLPEQHLLPLPDQWK